MASFITVPAPIVAFNAHFPLKTNPPIIPIGKTRVTVPTLWIHPPRQTSEPFLSSDVECLKWQAYLILRGLKSIKLRWDIAPEGCLGRSLPNLHFPKSENDEDGQLLPAHSILDWANMKLGIDPLEGYKDQGAMTESRAWVSLLEGVVHAAVVRKYPCNLDSCVQVHVP